MSTQLQNRPPRGKTFSTLVETPKDYAICQQMADEALLYYRDPYIAACEYMTNRVKESSYLGKTMGKIERNQISPMEKYQMMTVQTIILIAGGYGNSPYEEKVKALLCECREATITWRTVHDIAYDLSWHLTKYGVSCVSGKQTSAVNHALHYRAVAINGSTATLNLANFPQLASSFAVGKIDSISTKLVAEKALKACFPTKFPPC